MATLDFVYDLKEKMDEEDMEYTLLIIQHGAKESSVNAFYNVVTDDSADMLCAAMNQICETIDGDGNSKNLEILSIEEETEEPEKRDNDKDEKDES
jgi:hypothetical protein